MTVSDILTMFKTQGQSKGLDTIRFISNEDIAVYINQTIVNKVRAIVIQNAQSKFTDKVSMQDNPIASTNILRNLISYKDENISPDLYGKCHLECNIPNLMYITSVNVMYGTEIPQNPTAIANCRIIDYDKFYNHSDDYCNEVSWNRPIVTYVNHDNKLKFILEYQSNSFPTKMTPKALRIGYVREPDKFVVSTLNADYKGLPDYVIPEIVEIAVNTYFRSIGATSQQVNKQQEQTNQ